MENSEHRDPESGKRWISRRKDHASPRENRRIEGWLAHVHFRRMMFGGVDEEDVWRKIGELNELYAAALDAARLQRETSLENPDAAGMREKLQAEADLPEETPEDPEPEDEP